MVSKKTVRKDQDKQPFLGILDPDSADPIDPKVDRDPWTRGELRNMRSSLLYESLEELRSNLGPSKGQQKKRKDIMDWVLDDSEDPLSFRQTCTQEGLDHEALREQVLSLLRLNGIRFRIQEGH